MGQRMSIRIQLFGGFREFSKTSELQIEVPVHSSLNEIKIELEQELRKLNPSVDFHDFLQASVLANETQILGDPAEIPHGACLAILPPVCGG